MGKVTPFWLLEGAGKKKATMEDGSNWERTFPFEMFFPGRNFQFHDEVLVYPAESLNLAKPI